MKWQVTQAVCFHRKTQKLKKINLFFYLTENLAVFVLCLAKFLIYQSYVVLEKKRLTVFCSSTQTFRQYYYYYYYIFKGKYQ